MKYVERILLGALVTGVWSLVALQVSSNSQAHAQDTSIAEEAQQNNDTQSTMAVIHASEIVGLSALIEKTVRNKQLRPQSMPGLDQYIKSVVRGCRISGSVTGERISSANISC